MFSFLSEQLETLRDAFSRLDVETSIGRFTFDVNHISRLDSLVGQFTDFNDTTSTFDSLLIGKLLTGAVPISFQVL